MKKQIISMLLAIVMMAGLLPGTAMMVSAATNYTASEAEVTLRVEDHAGNLISGVGGITFSGYYYHHGNVGTVTASDTDTTWEVTNARYASYDYDFARYDAELVLGLAYISGFTALRKASYSFDKFDFGSKYVKPSGGEFYTMFPTTEITVKVDRKDVGLTLALTNANGQAVNSGVTVSVNGQSDSVYPYTFTNMQEGKSYTVTVTGSGYNYSGSYTMGQKGVASQSGSVNIGTATFDVYAKVVIGGQTFTGATVTGGGKTLTKTDGLYHTKLPVGSVTLSATATGVSISNTSATITSAGISQSSPLVLNGTLNTPAITGASGTIPLGSTTQLSVSNTVSGASYTWSSSNTAVATVDGTGKVTPLKEGVANITITCAYGSAKATNTVAFTMVQGTADMPEFSAMQLGSWYINYPNVVFYTTDIQKEIFKMPADLKDSYEVEITAVCTDPKGVAVNATRTIESPVAGETYTLDFGVKLRGPVTYTIVFKSNTYKFNQASRTTTRTYYHSPVAPSLTQNSFVYTGEAITPELTGGNSDSYTVSGYSIVTDHTTSWGYTSEVEIKSNITPVEVTALQTHSYKTEYESAAQTHYNCPYAVKIVGNEDNYYKGAVFLRFTVTPRPLTVKAKDQTISSEFPDIDTTALEITSGSLLSGHSLSGTVAVDESDSTKLNVVSATVTSDPEDSNLAARYTITTESGTLTVAHDHSYPAEGEGFCEICNEPQKPVVVDSSNYTSLGLSADYVGYYAISNRGQLYSFAQIVNGVERNANAVLTNDIDMKDIAWTPITSTGLYYSNSYSSGYGDNDTGYEGVFDGDGHVIKNISVTAESGKSATYGLFGTMTGTVKNLGIEGFTYNHNGASDMRTGAIAGQLLGGTIENCYVRNATINPGTNVAGAIAGCNYAGTIKNCYVADSTVIASDSRTGYIAGDNRADTAGDRLGTITNCYIDSYPLVGSYTSTETACRTHVSKTDFASGVITWYLNGESAEGIWKQGESYPDFTGTAVSENPINENEVPEVVDGIYQIANKSQMFYFANYVNYVDASASAILLNDIDLESDEWTPMGNLDNPYTGTFDGKGYTINNFAMNVTEGRQIGLFGYAEGATIKNFKIDGKVVLNYEKAESCYYGVIGSARSCTIEGIESYVNLEIKDTFAKSSVAGIVGSIEGNQKISKCAFYGTLDYGSADIDCGGGIVGYAGYNQTHVIEDCAFYGTIKSESETDDQIGGIIGYNRTNGNIMTIKNCVSAGTIELVKTTFAGMIGGRVLSVGNGNLGYIANNYYFSANSIPAFAQTTGYNYSGSELPDYADYGDSNAKAVDVAQLASGEVTYLLNNGVTDGTQVWKQTIDTDNYPVFEGGTVYKVYDCDGETVAYNNANENLPHTDENNDHKCDICGKDTTIKVTLDGVETTAVDGYIILGTDNGDGTYSLPANVVGYYLGDDFVDAGKYQVVGGEVITTVNFNVTMVNGAQVRYGGGLDENGKINTGNGLRFLATVDRSNFDADSYGMKLTAEGSTKETIVEGEKWQDDTTFSVAITDMAESNYIRKFTATPFVKVTYDDGTEKTIYGTDTVTRSIYQVASGLLKTNEQEGYGLVDVLNAYANQTGIRLVISEVGGEMKAHTAKYGDTLHFTVSDAAYDSAGNKYSVILTAQGNAEIITDNNFWYEYIRINNNNSLVRDKVTVERVEGNEKAVKVTFAADGLIERPSDSSDNTTPDDNDDSFDPETEGFN